jgi:hypothetical protein
MGRQEPLRGDHAVRDGARGYPGALPNRDLTIGDTG